MGFRCSTYNINKLAESFGMNKESVVDALKNARVGGFARMFKFEDKGTFGTGSISTSRRKDENSPWETDFQDGYVAFAGEAYKKAKELNIPENGIAITILNCEVRNKWDANTKKMYTNFYIYDFDIYGASNDNATKQAAPPKKPAAQQSKNDDYDESELPF